VAHSDGTTPALAARRAKLFPLPSDTIFFPNTEWISRGRDLASVSFYAGADMEPALSTTNRSPVVACRPAWGLMDSP
jgi:hypothetical protein